MKPQTRIELLTACASAAASGAVFLAPTLVGGVDLARPDVLVRTIVVQSMLHLLAGTVIGWRRPSLLPAVAVGSAAPWIGIVAIGLLAGQGDGQGGFVVFLLVPGVIAFTCIAAGGALAWVARAARSAVRRATFGEGDASAAPPAAGEPPPR